MTYLLAHYGVWTAIAFLLGALTAFGCRARPADATGLLRRDDYVVAVWLCLAMAVAQVTLGRIALYFDGALLLLAAFLAGFGAVTAVWGRVSRDRLALRIGAGALALTCAAANSEAARSLESDLRHRLGSLVAQAGGDPLNFEVSGRDVFLPTDTPGRAAFADRLDRSGGVRAVWTIDALSLPAAARRDRALAEADTRAAASRAALAEWEKRQAALPAPQERRSAAAPPPPSGGKGARTSERRDAAPTPAAPSGPIAWTLPHDPTLPGAVAAKEAEPALAPPPCRASLATLAGTETIRFPVKSATLPAGSQAALAKLAELLKQCPEATLEVRGHADSQGKAAENHDLSLRRARSVADYLSRVGVDRARMTSLGLGDAQPLTAGDTPTRRAENRRVEFGVK